MPVNCKTRPITRPLHKDTTAESCSPATLSIAYSLSQGRIVRFGT